LIYLSPSANLPVPPVVGDTAPVASSDITSAGLTYNPTVGHMCSTTGQASGLVVATVPVVGTLVAPGSSVKLVLSSGPCPVVARNVVGDTQSAATSVLVGQGLQPVYSPDPTIVCAVGAPQTVASQSPAGGTQVPYGSTVNLTLCQFTTPTSTS